MSLSIGLTLSDFSDLAAFQSGLELFVVQSGLEPEDIVTAQTAYSLIETARNDPFYSRSLRQMFLESARNNPRIAEVFLRALALKPSFVPQRAQRFATHFDPSLFLKERTGPAQLSVGASASQGPKNSPRRITASADKSDKPSPGKVQDVDAYVKISSLADAFDLPMRREVNMFMVVRLQDGSIVMRAGASSHWPMKGEDDRVASGWYEIKRGTVTLHIDDRADDISDVEIDRLIRSRIFSEVIPRDPIIIEFKTPHPAPAEMEERLRILRTANGNDQIYIPKDRKELFKILQTFENSSTLNIKGVIVKMADGQFELRLVGDNEGTHHSLVLLGEKMVWKGVVIGIPETDELSFSTSEYYGSSPSNKIKAFLRERFGDFKIYR